MARTSAHRLPQEVDPVASPEKDCCLDQPGFAPGFLWISLWIDLFIHV